MAVNGFSDTELQLSLERVLAVSGEITFRVTSLSEPTGAEGALTGVALLAAGILQTAFQAGAEAVNLEQGVREARVRIRGDGRSHELFRLPSSVHAALLALLKQAAGVGSAGGTLAEGNLRLRGSRGDMELHVCFLPTLNGAMAAIRFPGLADGSLLATALHRLGVFPDTLDTMDRLLTRPSGLLVVAGPTGTGKTTTLYALLHRLNQDTRQLMTVEKPVRHTLPGATQLAFRTPGECAAALRACLELNPNVVMVSHLPDAETVELAAQAGCLVLTALPVWSAASVPARLIAMGADRHLVADSFAGALGQRLVRRLCKACKKPAVPDPAQLERLVQACHPAGYVPPEGWEFQAAPGCAECWYTGYRGRIGLFELLEGSPAVRNAVLCNEPREALQSVAARQGFRSLAQDGLRKALAGLTSVEEVVLTVPLG